MGFDALAGLATKRIHALVGTDVVYTKTGGSAVTIKGVLDRRAVDVETEDGSLRTYSARVSFAEADLPTGYAEGDALTAKGFNYLVQVIESDGEGQIDMLLKRA